MKESNETIGKPLHTDMIAEADKSTMGKRRQTNFSCGCSKFNLVKHLANDPNGVANSTLNLIKKNYNVTPKAMAVFAQQGNGSGGLVQTGHGIQQHKPTLNEVARKTTMAVVGLAPGGTVINLMLNLFWPEDASGGPIDYWGAVKDQVKNYVNQNNIINVQGVLNGGATGGGAYNQLIAANDFLENMRLFSDAINENINLSSHGSSHAKTYLQQLFGKDHKKPYVVKSGLDGIPKDYGKVNNSESNPGKKNIDGRLIRDTKYPRSDLKKYFNYASDHLKKLDDILYITLLDESKFEDASNPENTLPYFIQLASIKLGAWSSMLAAFTEIENLLDKLRKATGFDFNNSDFDFLGKLTYQQEGDYINDYDYALNHYYQYAISKTMRCYKSRLRQISTVQHDDQTPFLGGEKIKYYYFDHNYGFGHVQYAKTKEQLTDGTPWSSRTINPFAEEDVKRNRSEYYAKRRKESSQYWQKEIIATAESWVMGTLENQQLQKVKDLKLGIPCYADADPVILPDDSITFVQDGKIYTIIFNDLYWDVVQLTGEGSQLPEAKLFPNSKITGFPIQGFGSVKSSIFFKNEKGQLVQLWDYHDPKFGYFDGEDGVAGKLLNVQVESLIPVNHGGDKTSILLLDGDSKLNEFHWEDDHWVHNSPEDLQADTVFDKDTQLCAIESDNAKHIFGKSNDIGKINKVSYAYASNTWSHSQFNISTDTDQAHNLQVLPSFSDDSIELYTMRMSHGSNYLTQIIHSEGGKTINENQVWELPHIKFDLPDFKPHIKFNRQGPILYQGVTTKFCSMANALYYFYHSKGEWNWQQLTGSLGLFKSVLIHTDAYPVVSPSKGVFIRTKEDAIYNFYLENGQWKNRIFIDNSKIELLKKPSKSRSKNRSKSSSRNSRRININNYESNGAFHVQKMPKIPNPPIVPKKPKPKPKPSLGDGGRYNIWAPNQVVLVTSEFTANAPILAGSDNDAKWQFTSMNDDSHPNAYHIQNAADDYYVKRTHGGVVMVVGDLMGNSPNPAWNVIPLGFGTYHLQSTFDQSYLAIKEGKIIAVVAQKDALEINLNPA